LYFPDPLVKFVTEKREKKVGVATRKKEKRSKPYMLKIEEKIKFMSTIIAKSMT
jgi:uracil phosphoribosyltransferase